MHFLKQLGVQVFKICDGALLGILGSSTLYVGLH